MDMYQVLGTGAFAGIVTFGLNFLKDYLSEVRVKKIRTKQEAFTLSNKLKLFSLRCQRKLDMHSNVESRPGHEEPDPPDFPDINFISITEELIDLDAKEFARIADLEFQKNVEEGYMEYGWNLWMDISDIEAFQLKRLKFFAEEASSLAATVRRKYNLPEFGDFEHLIKAEN